MRTDDGTLYTLPGLFHDGPDQAVKFEKHWKRGITFDLQGLPMIHENGVQTGVGARSWYNSAVLSAMLMLVSSSPSSSSLSSSTNKSTNAKNNNKKPSGEYGDDDDNNNNNNLGDMGNLLRQDMRRLMRQQERRHQKNPTVLEIGAGAIGLVGMTMAWILSHKQFRDYDDADADVDGNSKNVESRHAQGEGKDGELIMEEEYGEDCKIILTDNDPECLAQLQCNVNSVLASLLEFNSTMDHQIVNKEDSKEEVWSLSDDDFPFLSLPNIQTKVLDWNDHAIDQAVLLDHEIDFVVGAELAYTSNNCCALQVAKILQCNPAAIVWIVQFPRKGWLNVFQLELQRALPNAVVIQKMVPTDVHSQVHPLAQSIMPMPYGMGSNQGNDDVESHQDFSQRLEDIRALRITMKSRSNIDDDDEGRTTTNGAFGEDDEASVHDNNGDTATSAMGSGINKGIVDWSSKIQQAKQLAQQLNEKQECVLDSHWEFG